VTVLIPTLIKSLILEKFLSCVGCFGVRVGGGERVGEGDCGE